MRLPCFPTPLWEPDRTEVAHRAEEGGNFDPGAVLLGYDTLKKSPWAEEGGSFDPGCWGYSR